jgi:hypothetical protein
MTPETTANLETQSERTGPTGPRTEEGKARCRLNAFRHGLTGQIMVLSSEEQDVYKEHCSAIKTAYNPKGTLEENLVQSIGDSQWRLKRAAAFENSLFAMALQSPPEHPTGNREVDDAFTHACTWREQGKSLALLTTYESRIRRALEKDTAALAALQTARIENYREAMDVAKDLYKLAEAKGEGYNPESYFRVHAQIPQSVFSAAAVAHEIGRDQLKVDGREWALFGRLPKPQAEHGPEKEAA